MFTFSLTVSRRTRVVENNLEGKESNSPFRTVTYKGSSLVPKIEKPHPGVLQVLVFIGKLIPTVLLNTEYYYHSCLSVPFHFYSCPVLGPDNTIYKLVCVRVLTTVTQLKVFHCLTMARLPFQTNPIKMKSEMNLQFNLDHHNDGQDEDAVRLESRMDEFKQDQEKMDALNEFVDEVLQKAQTEVDRKSATKVLWSWDFDIGSQLDIDINLRMFYPPLIA